MVGEKTWNREDMSYDFDFGIVELLFKLGFGVVLGLFFVDFFFML